MRHYAIPERVRAQFPKNVNRTIMVKYAWRSSDGEIRPARNGSRGWTPIGQVATFDLLRDLREQGCEWVNLEASGVANPFRDAQIIDLV